MRRLLLATALLAGVTATVEAAAASDATGPLALRSSTLTQQGPVLTWRVGLRSPLPPTALQHPAAASLCLLLRTGKEQQAHQAVCVTGVRPKLGVQLEQLHTGGSVKSTAPLKGAKVTADGARTLAVSFPAASARLAGTQLRWQAAATSAQGCPSGTTGTTGTAPAPACLDLLPPDETTALSVAPPIATGCVASGTAQVRGAEGSPNAVALTFDDGPSPYTAQDLAILEREHVPATFFMIGKEVAPYGATLKRELRDGDALGNHTYTHANFSGGGATSQIIETNDVIRQTSGGYTPCVFRPPYGGTGPELVSEVRAQHMTSVLWNVDPSDYALPGAATIVSRVLAQVQRGSIIIMHDGGGPRDETVAALPAIIHALKARGFKLLTVPELLGYPNTY